MSAVAAEQPIDISALWRRVRYPAIIILVGLGLVTLLAAVGATSNSFPLDPRNTDPEGAHALSVLLGNRGISVSVANNVTQLDSSANDTVVISAPTELSERALRAVAGTRSPVLLVDPPPQALAAFAVPATADADTDATTLFPGCALPAATTAGSIQATGVLYAVHGVADGCYAQQGDVALVHSRRPDGADTFVIGSAATLENMDLAHQGDAALGLGLLNTAKVQWVPGGLGAGPASGGSTGLFNLLPSRLLWAVLQLFIALVVLALWRGRRLGKPVVEPLPVVVRAAETVEGRARLMHAAKARGAAARSLRDAAIRRLSRSLRLGADDDAGGVVALVAERTHRPPSEVTSLLYGGEPPDDARLVTLAQGLPHLEADVRQDAAPHPVAVPNSGGHP